MSQDLAKDAHEGDGSPFLKSVIHLPLSIFEATFLGLTIVERSSVG